jgi:hypothetical protein
MVAEKKNAGQSKGTAPQPPSEPPSGSSAGEKTGRAEQQGQPPAEGGTAKRKPWIKKTPVERILEQVQQQEIKVTALKKELEKEEAALKTMREATKLLGGS